MTFKGRETKVVLLGDAKKIFSKLESEMNSNKQSKILYVSIARSLKRIEVNPHAGIQISKKLIPKIYVRKYEVTNLWKINVSQFWRIIYWVDGKQVKVVSLVVDIVDHKQYDKIFGY